MEHLETGKGYKKNWIFLTLFFAFSCLLTFVFIPENVWASEKTITFQARGDLGFSSCTLKIWNDGAAEDAEPLQTVAMPYKAGSSSGTANLADGRYRYEFSSKTVSPSGGYFVVDGDTSKIMLKKVSLTYVFAFDEEHTSENWIPGGTISVVDVTGKDGYGYFWIDDNKDYTVSETSARKRYVLAVAAPAGSAANPVRIDFKVKYEPNDKNFFAPIAYSGTLSSSSANSMSILNNTTTTITFTPMRETIFRVPTQYAEYFTLYMKSARHYTPFSVIAEPENEEEALLSVAYLAEKIEQGDGYTNFVYHRADNTIFHYTIEGPGLIKLSREVSYAGLGAGDVITVYGYSVDKADYENKSQIITDHLTHFELPDADFRILAGRDKEDNLYLNVDDNNYIVMQPGDAKRIEAFRVWQAVLDILVNYFVEPNFTYEVIGSSIKQPEPGGAEGREYVTVRPAEAGQNAAHNGISFIKVGYEPMFWSDGDELRGNWVVPIFYNGIRPINTRVVVVRVGAANATEITTGIEQTEFDTIYYDKDIEDYAEYTFTPSASKELKVRVREPLVTDSYEVKTEDEVWNTGWTDGVKNADGSFTVHLKDGRNIIEISTVDESDNSVEYYVVNCRAVKVNVTNISRPDAADYQVGDTIEISLGEYDKDGLLNGLSLPVQKMAGIYNPNFPDKGWIEYTQSGTNRLFRSDKGKQYDVAVPEMHKITLTLNNPGEFVLTSGRIRTEHLGSGLIAHRNIDPAGLMPNLNASVGDNEPYFSRLPDIKLTVLPNSEEQAKKFLLAQLAEWLINGTYVGGNASDWAALDAIRNATQLQDYFNNLDNQKLENFDLEVTTSPVNDKDVTVALRYKEDGASEWQPLNNGVANGLSTKKGYMVEATVTPNNPEDGYIHTYTRHIVTAQNELNESLFNALPMLSNLQLDAGLQSLGVFNMDGLLMTSDENGAAMPELGYGFLATRNDFVVDLPSTVNSITFTATAAGEQRITKTDFGDLFLRDPVAPTVTVNGAAVDESGKITVDLSSPAFVEQTVAVARFTAKAEKNPLPEYQFSGEDENGEMKYWNLDEDGNAVYVVLPDTTVQAVADEPEVETETRTLETDQDGDGRVDTIYVVVTSNLEGKAAAAKTNTYTIHINYIQTVKVTMANKLAGGNVIIYNGDEIVTPNADGTYSLRWGEDYYFDYTCKGYEGIQKQAIEGMPNEAAWTFELPSLSQVNQQVGEATVRIVGGDSLLRATTTVHVDPFAAQSLAQLGYTATDYNGYTVLHALVEAGTVSGNATIFSCENGIFRPNDTSGLSGGWVCEVNHRVIAQADLQKTMLNAGDRVDFYWQPYADASHIWFADETGGVLENTTITQGESLTLKLQSCGGSIDTGSLVVYVGSRQVNATINGNEITISAADLSSPQSYFVSASAGHSSLAIAQVTVNSKNSQVTTPTGISVTFRLIGCSLTEDGQKIDFSESLLDYKGAEYQTWIPTTTFTFGLDEKVTVGDVFKKALDQRGLSYVGLDKNYISSITAPSVLGGYELAEITNGARSGWMYTVNGKHPDRGLNEWEVKNGDVIIWHYVNDYLYEVQDWSQSMGNDPNYRPAGNSKTWNKWLEAADIDPNPSMNKGATGVSGEKTSIIAPESNLDKNGVAVATVTYKEVTDAVKKAKDDEAKSITITPQNTGKAASIIISLTVDSAKDIAKAELGLNIDTTRGSLAIPDKALESIAAQAGGVDIRINIEGKDTKVETVKTTVDSALAQAADSLRGAAATLFENACVTEVTITSNGKEITSFGGHELTINLPVDSKNFTKDETYKVIVVSADGTVETITGTCLRVNGSLVVQVKVSHLSTFIVLNEKEQAETAKLTMNFIDVNESHWFYEAVKFVYEAGLMNGEGENTFNPQGNLNRAMLVTILYRLENTPEVTEANQFSDVSAGQWYTEAVIWASVNGIVNGYEDGTFAPTNNVTREEMAAMLMRYAEYKGIDVTATKDISGYNDAAKVSAWAQQNMAWSNSAGLIQGDENNNLNPQGKATRAEAATILMRLVKNVIG